MMLGLKGLTEWGDRKTGSDVLCCHKIFHAFGNTREITDARE